MRPYRKPAINRHRSYWLGTSNYYVLAVAVSVAVFFLVMALLRDGREEAFIPAGVAASGVLVGAVVVRRAILKNFQAREFDARRLENNLAGLRMNSPSA